MERMIDVWGIDYTKVPQKFLEESIDRLLDAVEMHPEQEDEIRDMIFEIHDELVRRLYEHVQRD